MFPTLLYCTQERSGKAVVGSGKCSDRCNERVTIVGEVVTRASGTRTCSFQGCTTVSSRVEYDISCKVGAAPSISMKHGD